MSLYDEVYGLKYTSAKEQMALLTQGLKQQNGQGFETLEDLEQWAHDHLLDKTVFSNMSHKFMCISHKGEIMQPEVFEQYYGSLLFVVTQHGKTVRHEVWHPGGFEYYDNAYIVGEQSDGIHKPLYYRDYTVPTGYYSPERDAFNVAKPFPVFAANTGRDTSHIYKYIEHIAGECTYHLLAWLRAKLLHPTTKTQVVPIIVSRTQGSGKTTFAEVICKGLFGKDNVIVSDQYDSTARFNADYADALIVCQEEKELEDRRNPAGALKSRATATTIRKEQKGVDPIYQESYTDFIMTTNKDVPIKFDGREDQRRFMVMESDPDFTRKTSELADEVFTKLYGYDANYNKVGTPFTEDKELIAQFKHELFTRKDIAEVNLREFPKTAAYKRCFTLPRTSEAVEIESVLRALAPYIKASLEQKKLITEIESVPITDVIQHVGAIQYMPAFKEFSAYIALCRPLVFYEMGTMKPFTHSVVERSIYDCATWLLSEFNLIVMPDMDPLPGGFTKVTGRYRTSSAARFCLAGEQVKNIPNIKPAEIIPTFKPVQDGKRLRVDKYFKVNDNGCFETVNVMKPGITSLKNKTENVLHMDTFLFESDTPTKLQEEQEKKRAAEYININGEGSDIKASELYKERLELSLSEAKRLFNDGIAARIVYSGAKSYHIIIRVADEPDTLEQYKWLHGYLCQNLSDKIIFDESTSDPARLTRSPLTLERTTSAYGLLVTGTQQLVCENWNNVYNIPWRNLYEQWTKRPLGQLEKAHGKPLFPTRPEYIDAANDIVSGIFWSNEKYNGDRQRLFFPAYRLLRALGYSSTELWEDVIIPGLQGYKKKDEVNYWKSRRNSLIIRQIDTDISEHEEEEDV